MQCRSTQPVRALPHIACALRPAHLSRIQHEAGIRPLSHPVSLLCPLLPPHSPTPPHNRRLSRIQQEAGIKPQAPDAAGGTDGSDDDGGGDMGDAAAGTGAAPGGKLAGLLDELLDGEFDPEEYDRRMAAAFDDAYYEVRDCMHACMRVRACVLVYACVCVCRVRTRVFVCVRVSRAYQGVCAACGGGWCCAGGFGATH